jgi:hypothetical protein
MARNIKQPEPLSAPTERRVVSLRYFLEPLDDKPRAPAYANGVEPRRMVMLAERAHQADQIEQAKSLIEEAYALYDQCTRAADEIASDGTSASSPEPKTLTSTMSWRGGTRWPPLS